MAATDDMVEIQQVLARYAVALTRGDIDGLLAVFAPDGTYSAFGDTYSLDRFPELVGATPKGLFLAGTPALEVDGYTGIGTQPYCFVEHATHNMRIGYYRDTCTRTPAGWRLQTRSSTFIRRSGAHDAGRPHEVGRPRP